MPGENVKKTLVREVKVMVEPDISEGFVSLVKRGANQTPFTVAKSSETEGRGMAQKRVIQALLVPDGLSIEAIKSHDGLDGLRLEEGRKVEGGMTAYTVIKSEEFDAPTMELVTLDATTGLKAVVGVLKKEEGFAKKLFSRKEEKAAVCVPDGLAPDQVQKGDLYDEVYALENIIFGILRQQYGSASEKQQAIAMAVDNFQEYVNAMFSVLKEDAAQPFPAPKDKTVNKEEVEPMKPEEITTLVEKTVTDKTPEAVATVLKSDGFKKAMQSAIKEAVVAATAPMQEQITAQKAEIDTLKKTPATASKQTGDDNKQTPAAKSEGFNFSEDTAMKRDGDTDDADACFKGLLFNIPAAG